MFYNLYLSNIILQTKYNNVMELPNLNFFAVLVAAVSSFLVGSIWYSPILFGKAWMKELNFTDEDLRKGNVTKLYILSFVVALIIAVNLAFFIGNDAGLVWGMTAGFLAGFGWVAMAIGLTYLFEDKSLRLYLINAGYHVVTFTISGGIIGVWQ